MSGVDQSARIREQEQESRIMKKNKEAFGVDRYVLDCAASFIGLCFCQNWSHFML